MPSITGSGRTRGQLFRVAAASVLSFGVVVATANPALATSCPNGIYRYGGEHKYDGSFQGLQGELGNESGQDIKDAIHIVNYYDQSDFADSCDGQSSCWIQAGFGQGDVGGYNSPSDKHAYDETNDVNEYNVNWRDTSDVTGSDHASYISISFVERSGGDYLFQADAYSTNGEAYLGEAWLPANALGAAIETETLYPTGGGTCSVLNSPVYFGANASGGTASGTLIEKSSNDGSSWSDIGNGGWTTDGPEGDLTMTELDSNTDAFKVTNSN